MRDVKNWNRKELDFEAVEEIVQNIFDASALRFVYCSPRH
jgi:hypothetical protein